MTLKSSGPTRNTSLGMNKPYSTLATLYDPSMDVDYKEWVQYLLALGLRHHHVPGKILDLGCGTGNLTIPLAKRGYPIMGVDLSREMIEVAKEKALALEEEIAFLVGDMRSFSLPGEFFDTVISGCDVLNYLTSEADLASAFRVVDKLLHSGGLWFFDLNSACKLRHIYGNESYADLQDTFAYFWDNSYDDSCDICTMNLTFFVQKGAGLYERRVERHRQKLWTPQAIRELCAANGFLLQACYDFLTFEPCSTESHRWQFVVEKR